MNNNLETFIRSYTKSGYEYKEYFSDVIKTNSGLLYRIVISKRGLSNFIRIVRANFTSFFSKSSFCEVSTEFIFNPKTFKDDIELTLNYIELLKSEDDLIC